MERRLIPTAILAAVLLLAGFAYAAELYINSAGVVQIEGAEVSFTNNNVITVSLWGTRWILYVDPEDTNVKITNAAGEPITVWQLEKGHILYVEGRARETNVIGRVEIEVRLIHDMSIPGSGPALPPPSVKPTGSFSSAAIGVPPPPTVSSSATPPASSQSGQPSASNRISRGMRGEKVRMLQEVLLKEGYLQEDEVTGYFGAATESAVKQLQKANGIAQEGFVGSLTRQIVESLRAKSLTVKSGTESGPENGLLAGGQIIRRLQKGMRGDDVKALQEALLAQGYLKSDEATGFFGDTTEVAVKKLQKANGIAQEGFLGPLTKRVVNTLLAGSAQSKEITSENTPQAPRSSQKQLTKNLKPGMHGHEVMMLQEFLQKNSWGIPNDGPVTGYYGTVTVKAVAAFQEANGLEAAGIAGPLTRDLINKLLNQ